jgi:hypothetical protein
VTRQHIYVAITRCRDLSKINVFVHSKNEVSELNRSKILQHFTNMIEEYKVQDKRAKRELNDDTYINLEWLVKEYNSNKFCPACHNKYILGVVDGSIESNLTVDRVLNNRPHDKDNCRLCCLQCNVIRANRYDL